MEIQRHSSCEGIAALKKALDGCDYFAIDFEFSGLVEYIPEYSSLESAEEDLLRTPRYKYEEKRDQINMNIPIQVGVSVFTKVQSHNTTLSVVFASQICQYEHQLNYDHLKLLQSCVKDLDVADQRSKVALVDDALHRIQSEKCTDLTPDAYSASLIKHGRHRESIDVACKLLEYWRSRIEATTQQHKELAVTPPVYTAQNFSAFLFPSPTSERFQSFGVVSDTMGEFLRKADMDFNQWIRNGLRFGTVSEWMADDHSPLVSTVEHLRALPFFSMTAPPLFTESVEPFLPLTSHEAAYLMMAIKLVQSNKDTALFGDLVNLVVMRGRGNTSAALNFIPSSFCERRRQLLQQMGLRLENKRAVRSSNDGSLELTANTNFDGTRLLSLLVEAAADKPMILHNGFLDLMFFVRALHGSVPEAYADFVQVIRCHFPKFYDTRMLLTHPHMFQHGNFSASLFDSFRVMREKSDLTTPQIVRDAKLAGAVDMESLNRAHDAGGDAFITGCLFAFAEHELQKSGRNVNRYNGVVPLHGIVQFASFHSGRQQWAAFGAPCYYVFARSTDVQLMKNILSPPYIFRTCYDGMLTCILAPNPEAGTVAVSTLLNALSQRRIPHKLLHFAATNQCRILDA